MSKKKRTFNSDVDMPSLLRLDQTTIKLETNPDESNISVPKKQYFTPELIARLTERIKKI